MSIVGRFIATIEAAGRLQNVRAVEDNERVTRVSEHEICDLLQVAEKVHGRGERTEEVFRKRFLQGEKAYLLRKGAAAVCYVWFSGGECEVYDLRIDLRLPPAAGYFFDVGTAPGYRGAGMLGKVLAHAWAENSLEMATCCIRSDNQPSISAFERLGFRPIFTATLTRLVFLRVHTIRDLETGSTRRTFSGSSLRPNPHNLICCVGKHGLAQIQKQ